MRVGFTGTRHGMTAAQLKAVHDIIESLAAENRRSASIQAGQANSHSTFDAHHGDCVGADAEFHALVRRWPSAYVIVHPGPADDSDRQAGCDGDERRPPARHMARNRRIVASSTVMIAAPVEMAPQERGGTWATIRMARKASRQLAIVWPDGSVTKERWP